MENIKPEKPKTFLKKGDPTIPDYTGLAGRPFTTPCPSHTELVELHIQLDPEPIWYGPDPEKCTVWEVKVTNKDQVPFPVPPLVAKIAAHKHGRLLAQEAGMYQYLRSLQGTMLPRCYGLFFGVVDLEEYTVVPWDRDHHDPYRTAQPFPRLFDKYTTPNSRAGLAILLLENVGLPATHERREALGLRVWWDFV